MTIVTRHSDGRNDAGGVGTPVTYPHIEQRRPKRHGRLGLRRTDAASLDRLLTTAPAAQAQGREWARAHRRRVQIVDALIVVAVVALAQLMTLELLSPDVTERVSWPRLTLLSVILACSWLLALELLQSRDISLVGIGTEEYRRVATATASIFGLVAVLSVLLREQVSRGYLAVALTLGLIGLIAGRHFVRTDLARRRTRGEFITRVVVLGKPDSVRVLCDSFQRSTAAGYRVVGVCIPEFGGEVGEELITSAGAMPVLGDQNSVESALSLTRADALAIAAVEHLGPEKLKKLVWRLESLETDLIVMPGMTDIAGPRLRMRPIDNLPLFHIAPPRREGTSAVAKRLFDLVFGSMALLAALPVMVVAAIAIKLGDSGPVIFHQSRVGYGGKRFRICKFRTMTVDAEARKDAERDMTENTGVFYKSVSDSRITRVGRLLRATSIDELPQLFNVLGGSMSVVGPRPLVPGEGESVEHFVERRGMVKPGITGLWQISGRSDVSEEERIRLDHSYVDNWSCMQDLVIVWRTVRAVLKREGAY
jgi:exopolysaccharide biosynthesis polyprenyl glycosylphosphotransferase